MPGCEWMGYWSSHRASKPNSLHSRWDFLCAVHVQIVCLTCSVKIERSRSKQLRTDAKGPEEALEVLLPEVQLWLWCQ